MEIQRGDHDIPFLPRQSLVLRGMVETALADLSNVDLEQQEQVDISVFMNKSTKGSRRFRKVICKDYQKALEISPNIKKFSENTEFICNRSASFYLNSLWNLSFLDNSIRTFIFKLHNNTLGFNHAVAHFVNGHSPNCTFCDLSGDKNYSPETPFTFFMNAQW